MRIALYKGLSLWPSRMIRWLTRSPYSHAAWVFDAHSQAVAAGLVSKLPHLRHLNDGACVEAWQGGVKCSLSISTLHTPGTPVDLFTFATPLTDDEEARLLVWLDSTIGDPYSYWGVLRFITRRPSRDDGSWFCSEHVAGGCEAIKHPLFARTEDWRVPPDWISRTIALNRARSVFTSSPG